MYNLPEESHRFDTLIYLDDVRNQKLSHSGRIKIPIHISTIILKILVNLYTSIRIIYQV